MTGSFLARFGSLGVALAGTLTLLNAVGCQETEGVRVEGTAPTVSESVDADWSTAEGPVPAAPPADRGEPLPTGTGELDRVGGPEGVENGVVADVGDVGEMGDVVATPGRVVELLRADRGEAERTLLTCPERGGTYPVSVDRAALTGTAPTDLVVNVTTCDEGIGVGAYVYRAVEGRYVNVFRVESASVWATVTGEGLQVTRQRYAEDDPVYSPSGETVTMYRWDGSAFVETSEQTRDHGK